MATFTWPPLSVTASSGPVQFVLNGVDTEVSQDTSTPSNSRPLPVAILSPSGVPFDVTTLAKEAKQDTGNASLASIDSKLTAPLSVTGPLTDAQLRNSAVPVSGPLTDTQLRASPVPVSAASLPLPSGAATETTLSAINTKTPSLGQAAMAASVPVVIANNQSAVPVSGPLTDTQLRASAVPVSGPLTDTQLRASAVPVSGPLTDTQLRASAVPVSGPLTDTQLRASAVPVSVSGNVTTTPLSNVSGTGASSDTLSTSAVTLTAPADAVGFFLSVPSSNAGGSLYWQVGAGVTTATGHLMETGRDTGYVPLAASISVIADAANTSYRMTWVRK